MKTAILFLAALLIPITNAHADPDSATGRHGGAKTSQANSSAKNTSSINGTCSIIASPNNPFPGPCVSLLLILSDPSGEQITNTRTGSQGQFEFSAEAGKSYKITSGSKSYEVVSPKDVVRPGDRVSLQLQQKQP